MKKTYGAKFRPGILLENGNKKDETYHVVACEAQTHFRSSLLSLRKIFFGGREATTGNASALRRLSCAALISTVEIVLDF